MQVPEMITPAWLREHEFCENNVRTFEAALEIRGVDGLPVDEHGIATAGKLDLLMQFLDGLGRRYEDPTDDCSACLARMTLDNLVELDVRYTRLDLAVGDILGHIKWAMERWLPSDQHEPYSMQDFYRRVDARTNGSEVPA